MLVQARKAGNIFFSTIDTILGDAFDDFQFGAVKFIRGNDFHVTNITTGLQTEVLVDRNDMEGTRKGLRNIWIDISAGAAYFTQNDASTNFNALVLRHQAGVLGKITHFATTETRSRIGSNERNYLCVGTVYDKLWVDRPSLSNKEILHLHFES